MALTPAEKQRAYRERLRLKALGQLPAAPVLCNIPAQKRWDTMRDQARNLLQKMVEEMQEYYDERSDEWKESDRAQELQERIDAVAAVLDDLDAIE